MERLKIPENISLTWELWRGFGKKELAITGIILTISVAVAVVYAQISRNDMSTLKAVGGVLLMLFGTISMLNKIEYNQSLVDYIRKSLRFRKEQQQFYYKNGEEVVPYVEESAK